MMTYSYYAYCIHTYYDKCFVLDIRSSYNFTLWPSVNNTIIYSDLNTSQIVYTQIYYYPT